MNNPKQAKISSFFTQFSNKTSPSKERLTIEESVCMISQNATSSEIAIPQSPEMFNKKPVKLLGKKLLPFKKVQADSKMKKRKASPNSKFVSSPKKKLQSSPTGFTKLKQVDIINLLSPQKNSTAGNLCLPSPKENLLFPSNELNTPEVGIVELLSPQKSSIARDLFPLEEKEEDADDDDDIFEDWDDSLNFVDKSFMKSLSMSEESVPALRTYQRFTVLNVNVQSYKEVQIELKSVTTKATVLCILNGSWVHTNIKAGDIVHIEGSCDNNQYTIDDTTGFIIVNPDFLVSGTSIVSTLFCSRKTVLNEKFRGFDPGNVHMLHGNLIHQLFQKVVSCKVKTMNEMKLLMDDVICCSRNLHEIYGQGLVESEVREEIKKILPHIFTWCKNYIHKEEKTSKSKDLIIEDIMDIEENFWSPRYGIKGKVDMTLKTLNHFNDSQVIPLELKTGRATFSAEHEGQVTLYNMMMKERYSNASQGYLLYLKENVNMKQIALNHKCERGLLQTRNELMSYLTVNVKQNKDGFDLPDLPDPVDNKRFCAKCPQLLNCALYQQKVDSKKNSSQSEAMKVLVADALKHLDEVQKDFFIHWNLLLHLEMQLDRKMCRVEDIWLSLAADREVKGECFSGMVITQNLVQEISHGQFLHTFEKKSKDASSLNEVGFCQYDMCIISNQDNLDIAISSGVIMQIHQDTVQIILDRNLTCVKNWKCKVYRIDRNDSFSTFSMNLTNLSELMMPANSTLRSFIINKTKPNFKCKLSKEIAIKGKPIFKKLNKPQQKAIFKTLMAEDYILMKGMPGTGKTLTIVSLVEVLLLVKQTVLITAYTHSAVDNILVRLLQTGIKNFVRLGKFSRLHKSIQPYSADELTKNFNSVDQLSQFYQSVPIVATTCLGANHPIFKRRNFDICIVDEASQVLLPSCLGPLFHSSKFVLVGDPKQLPPVVKNKSAEKLGMTESLFSHIENETNTVNLNLQYRMNSEITRISNGFMYNGDLICGNEQIENATLNISIPQCEDEWLKKCLDNKMSNSVLFLSTDTVPLSHEQDAQGLVYNTGESQLVLKICQALIKGGLQTDCIGVIAPYRRQVRHVKETLVACDLHEIDVNTVDQYQGQEKNVIIISCVRTSFSDNSISQGILHDSRRLNVAITRAKHKVILIGSLNALNTLPPFQKLLSIINLQQKVNLPAQS